MNLLTRQIVVEAIKHVGTKEAGHNAGPEVAGWLKRVHRRTGSPWCCAFAWCMLDDACTAIGVPNPFPPVAGVHYAAAIAKRLGCWTPEAGPGYICLHDSGKNAAGARIGHCGVVVEVNGQIKSVEGNTNAEGSREGDRVALKSRPVAYWGLGFIDPGKLFA